MRRAAEKWRKERMILSCIAGFLLAMSALAIAVAFMCLRTTCNAAETEELQFSEPLEIIPIPPVDEQIIIVSGPGTVINITCEPEYIITFTEDERQLFEGILAAESYSFWDYDELMTLASVIMNRILSDDFPDTLEGVLTQRRQFTTYSNGRYATAEVTDTCKEVVEAALRGETNVEADVFWFCTREYYESDEVSSFFLGLNHVLTCRNVYLFKEF